MTFLGLTCTVPEQIEMISVEVAQNFICLYPRTVR